MFGMRSWTEMRARYNIDPDTEQPHIYSHALRESEAEASQYLRVIYVPDPEAITSLQRSCLDESATRERGDVRVRRGR